MTLARLMDHRAELRADFRQYYGCSFDRTLEESVSETADLAMMLPRGSRTFAAIDPEFSWEQQHYLLAEIANSLHLLLWCQTKDGQKGRNRPRPILPPTKREDRPEAHSVEELQNLLSKPRKGVS